MLIQQNFIYKQNYSKYNDMAWQYGIDGDTFACLMLAYHEIVRQYKIIDTIAPEKKMCSYLVRIMKEFDNTYNGGSISDEFISKINSMLVSGKHMFFDISQIYHYKISFVPYKHRFQK